MQVKDIEIFFILNFLLGLGIRRMAAVIRPIIAIESTGTPKALLF